MFHMKTGRSQSVRISASISACFQIEREKIVLTMKIFCRFLDFKFPKVVAVNFDSKTGKLQN